MGLKLHVETVGQGADVFLVHGWALHSGIWGGLLPELARSYRVTCVDLPGHGRSHDIPMPAELKALARQLMAVAPQNAVWLGWSLGGLACLRGVLDFPDRIRALVLVSATPRFIRAPDWHHAMPLEQLQALAADLGQDYHATVQRFLTVQVHGDAQARTTLRQLRNALLARAEPSASSLEKALMLLRDSDVRAELSRIHLPTLIIAGAYDRLVPASVTEWLATAIEGAQRILMLKSAHAPFLSHTVEFSAALRQFLQVLPVTPPVSTTRLHLASAQTERQL